MGFVFEPLSITTRWFQKAAVSITEAFDIFESGQSLKPSNSAALREFEATWGVSSVMAFILKQTTNGKSAGRISWHPRKSSRALFYLYLAR